MDAIAPKLLAQDRADKLEARRPGQPGWLASEANSGAPAQEVQN